MRDPPEEAAWLTLTVVGGPFTGQTFHFSAHDVFLVGRSDHARLRVPTDRYLSRVHFMVEINPPVCRLTDQGSNGGTFVNGVKVQTADLCHGDVIRGGQTDLSVSIPWFAETIHPSAPSALEPSAAEPPTTPAGGPAPETPRSVAGYQILKELGRGAMGVVYLAERAATGERVALKTILPAVASECKATECFLREVEIVQSLSHPRIVTFHEAGECAGLLYFAMEYVEGTDAARLVKRKGPLPVQHAVRLVCQLLSALEYAHARQLVHRDVKPANVLIAADGKRKAA